MNRDPLFLIKLAVLAGILSTRVHAQPGAAEFCSEPDQSCFPGGVCNFKGVCECKGGGTWSHTARMCVNDEFCRTFAREWGISYMFHRNGSELCTCGLGFECLIVRFEGAVSRPGAECPDNSVLTTTAPYTCKCAEGLVPSMDARTCVTPPKYGDQCWYYSEGGWVHPCPNGTECQPTRGDNRCECPSHSPWDSDLGRCRLRLDSPCAQGDEEDVCIENAECSSGVCACKPGFSAQLQHVGRQIDVCQLNGSLGATCDRNEDCNNFTRCEYSTDYPRWGRQCTCHGDWSLTDQICRNEAYCDATHFANSFYDAKSGFCKCLIGATCIGNHGEPLEPGNCPTGSKPHEAGCECESGLYPFNEGKACASRRGYGEMCEFRGQCTNGSQCEAQMCTCAQHLIWNQATGACMVKSGRFCQGELEPCTPNTKCEEMRGNSNAFACICPAGFNVTATGECFAPHGALCRSDGNCAPPLRCVDGVCACRDLIGQFYKEENEICVGLVGGMCNSASACVPGATCVSATGTCQCIPGTMPASNRGRCVKALSYRANCTGRECDHGKGFACIGSICMCADSGMVYSDNLQACVSPPGFTCGNFSVANSCVELAGGAARLCEKHVLACAPGSECTNGICAAISEASAPPAPQLEHEA